MQCARQPDRRERRSTPGRRAGAERVTACGDFFFPGDGLHTAQPVLASGRRVARPAPDVRRGAGADGMRHCRETRRRADHHARRALELVLARNRKPGRNLRPRREYIVRAFWY